VESSTLNTTLGTTAPLQNLSPRSYNLTGMYDKGRLSARLSYNWRDRYLSGVATYSGVGAVPIYTHAYGWLDASLSYRLNDKVSFILQGHNLLGTVRTSYYGVETRPYSAWLNDIQISAAMTVRF
jgi:outer membrane receptor protein involved in Fe transport